MGLANSKVLTHDGQQITEVLISLETLVDAVVYMEGQCIGPSFDMRIGLPLWNRDSVTSAGRQCSCHGMFCPCQGSKALIGNEPGTMYIWAEQEGVIERPGATNGIQLVVTPLLISASLVVVMIERVIESTPKAKEV
jgi:hypothetical protein